MILLQVILSRSHSGRFCWIWFPLSNSPHSAHGTAQIASEIVGEVGLLLRMNDKLVTVVGELNRWHIAGPLFDVVPDGFRIYFAADSQTIEASTSIKLHQPSALPLKFERMEQFGVRIQTPRKYLSYNL